MAQSLVLPDPTVRAIARLEGCDVALDSDRYVDVLRAYLRLLHAYGRE